MPLSYLNLAYIGLLLVMVAESYYAKKQANKSLSEKNAPAHKEKERRRKTRLYPVIGITAIVLILLAMPYVLPTLSQSIK